MNHVISVKKRMDIKKRTGTELDLKYQLGKQPLANQPDIVVVDKEGGEGSCDGCGSQRHRKERGMKRWISTMGQKKNHRRRSGSGSSNGSWWSNRGRDPQTGFE